MLMTLSHNVVSHDKTGTLSIHRYHLNCESARPLYYAKAVQCHRRSYGPRNSFRRPWLSDLIKCGLYSLNVHA